MCIRDSSTIVFSENTDDHGNIFIFNGVDNGRILLKPKIHVENIEDYNSTLIFAEKDNVVCFFMARLEYVIENIFYYTTYSELFQRKVRSHKRIALPGQAKVCTKDGRTLLCEIVDFSPTGISLKSCNNDFSIGEMLLLEVEIPDCGVCETTINISRLEACGSHDAIYGARLNLTKEQEKKSEQLYLCKKAVQIQNLPKNSAVRIHDLRWRD